MHRALAALFAAPLAVLVTTTTELDAEVARSSGLATRKDAVPLAVEARDDHPDLPPLLATLVQTHTDERVPLDDGTPTLARFSALLADRVTGDHKELDPRLLGLLRDVARRHPRARIELVSGYRSPKLNEMLRKKGHHVASHSQHSLGHAVDFRVVPPPDEADAGADGAVRGIDPLTLEREIRDLGWHGGVGVYLLKTDWFVHADVGPQRRWNG